MECPALPESSTLPSFRDEGSYTVIGAGTNEVLAGRFFLDTRYVEQMGDSGEWESMLKIVPEGGIVPANMDESSNVADMYMPQGKIWRLWDVSDDPDGSKASEFHQRILELVQQGESAKDIQEVAVETRDRLS